MLMLRCTSVDLSKAPGVGSDISVFIHLLSSSLCFEPVPWTLCLVSLLMGS